MDAPIRETANVIQKYSDMVTETMGKYTKFIVLGVILIIVIILTYLISYKYRNAASLKKMEKSSRPNTSRNLNAVSDSFGLIWDDFGAKKWTSGIHKRIFRGSKIFCRLRFSTLSNLNSRSWQTPGKNHCSI